MSTQPIKDLFASIATTYDRVNSLASFGFHKTWNRALVNAMGEAETLLDLCAGTGEISCSYLQKYPQARAILLDFCKEMLLIAETKIPLARREILHADAQDIPLAASSVGAITIAYGIRNISQPIKCFSEAFRVLRPQGKLGILELTRPRFFLTRFFHQLHLQFSLPLLGQFVAQNKEAYRYLARSIRSFSSPEQLTKQLLETGFSAVEEKSLLGGIATLLVAQK